MATVLPNGKQSYTTSSGAPLVGGKVYTYEAGTTTPKATYTTASESVANANPVILDARGEASIFWNGSYKIVLKDASDVTIWTQDNVSTPSTDTTLRAELAAATGSTLIGTKRPEAPAVLRLLSARNDEIIYAKDYISSPNAGQSAYDFTQNFIDLLAAAPQASIIDFSHGLIEGGGEFKVTAPITITKGQSLRGKPGSTRIRGEMSGANDDIIRFVPNTESRRAFIEGIDISHYGASGRHAVLVGAGATGILGWNARSCIFTAGPTTSGRAIRFEGLGCHWNQVINCDIPEGGVEIAGADGTKVLECRISGIRCGVRVLTLPGAYKTGIIGGTISSRDGGVYLGEVQQVDIERVQFEQGIEAGRASQVNAFKLPDGITPAEGHIIGYGGAELCRDIRIIGNNFGSGSNQAESIILSGYNRDWIIDGNVFANVGTSTFDAVLLANNNFYIRIGDRNRVYGERGVSPRGAANTLDPRKLLNIFDGALGTYGFSARKTGAALTFANSWAAGADFAIWKDEADMLQTSGTIVHGVNGAGTLVCTLPPTMRPAVDSVWCGSNALSGGGVPFTRLSANAATGEVRVIGAEIATTETVMLPMKIKGQLDYLSGPF